MPQTWIHVKALKDYNRAPNSCNGFITDNYCRNEGEIIYGSAEVDRGGGSKCRAVSVCTDNVDGGGGSNPCAYNAPVKARNRRYIHQHHGWAGLPANGLGLECEWISQLMERYEQCPVKPGIRMQLLIITKARR